MTSLLPTALRPFATTGRWAVKPDPATNVCFKIFIVVSIVIAAVVIVTGILAIMASQGKIPSGIEQIKKLNVIGEVNSYVMLAGGVALFVLSIVAWTLQFHKEHQQGI